MNIVVSSFFDLSRYGSSVLHNSTTYVTKAHEMLNLTKNIQWHIYTDIPEAFGKQGPNVTMHQFDPAPYFEGSKFLQRPSGAHHIKDTAHYLITQLLKTRLVELALKECPDALGAVWIDAGIGKVLQNIFEVYKRLEVVASSKLKGIALPGFWQGAGCTYPTMEMPIWVFAGGFFAGSRDSILAFAEAVEQRAAEYRVNGQITWEVNVWYDVYIAKQDEIEMQQYICSDHNDSLVLTMPI